MQGERIRTPKNGTNARNASHIRQAAVALDNMLSEFVKLVDPILGMRNQGLSTQNVWVRKPISGFGTCSESARLSCAWDYGDCADQARARV